MEELYGLGFMMSVVKWFRALTAACTLMEERSNVRKLGLLNWGSGTLIEFADVPTSLIE